MTLYNDVVYPLYKSLHPLIPNSIPSLPQLPSAPMPLFSMPLSLFLCVDKLRPVIFCVFILLGWAVS